MSTVKTREEQAARRKKPPLALLLGLAVVVLAGAAIAVHFAGRGGTEPGPEKEPEPLPLTTAYVASPTETATATVYDEEGNVLQELTLFRGAEVRVLEEEREPGVLPRILVDEAAETFASIPEENLTDDPAGAVTTPYIYAARTVNLLDETLTVPGALVEKGDRLAVTGFAGLDEQGAVALWQVEGGWLPADLAAADAGRALAVGDEALLALHAQRGDPYGGGEAGGLDFEPWDKTFTPVTPMPETVKALYMNYDSPPNVEDFIDIAKGCGINAFVVDIVDGERVAYRSPTIEAVAPSAYDPAYNDQDVLCTLEEYQHACRRLKEEGFYLIGRITAFNDPYLANDHPEWVVCRAGTDQPLMVAGMYWPSVYERNVWKYKVDLALEAAELMGFDEIQFDYIRFPDQAWEFEEAGVIDYRNAYGESKAQAVQRFLMYADRRLHAAGVYLSGDVFGECAEPYVTAYGQYWPAISAVVDAISGMPYPDHYPAQGDYLPWMHPYETLYTYGTKAMARQEETPGTPAAVRTWIQAYNAIEEPYPTYGPDEVSAQIRALEDAGCTGGYMTWNGAGSRDKYRYLMPALT